MIVFEKITGKNFLSFEEFELEFKTGKHLILGTNLSTDYAESNGSGKSALIEALSWCLYKKSTRGRDISRDGKGKCEVSLHFSIKEDSYQVIRTAGTKNTVKILCNGENISPRNSENIEDVIERTVGTPYDLFVVVVTVLQGLPVNFSTMTPTIRKSVLESIMGLDDWEQISKMFQNKKFEVLADMKELEEEYDNSRSTMIEKNATLETMKRAMSKQVEDFSDEINRLHEQISKATTDLENLRDKRDAFAGDTEVSDLREEVSDLTDTKAIIKKELDNLYVIVDEGRCPTCGQDYPQSLVEEAEAKIKGFEGKLPKIESRIKDRKSLIGSIEDMDGDVKAAQREVRMLQLNVDSLVSRSKSRKDKVDVDLDVLQDQLDEVVALVNTLDGQLQELSEKVSGVDYIIKLLTPSSTFRTTVLEQYLDFVNSILREISPTLLDNILISLEVDKKANGVEIILNDGKREYRSLSGGEKRRVDLIIILTLQKFLLECTGVSTNLLMFDEIFDSLDGVGIQMVLNCIDIIFDDDLCVYVTTHKSEFRSSFDSILEIEKVDNISNLI